MMRPLDLSQIEIMDQVLEFKGECAANGLRIDQGQAYECLLTDDASRARLARRFHNRNIRIDRSCGEVHFSGGEDDFFDLPAPPVQDPEDGEEKLNEIMMLCPIRHREKIIRVLLEMKRVGGADTITSSAPAVGITRAVFYRILAKVRKWVTRPPTPEGWSGIDCALLSQLELNLGGEE
ncbi:hypothetical protein [Halothiobacillus neapolitanus]|uniref:Uncharacterized protein n=1 Tax=Halothiobacillus neapolitanus (strain ATCC 23641 / DSM 15147 / CIP 104769 / NCIMB 8539 / c2) TaxID=555778 RepID=D0KZA1_HALNC|nr:hypothetical protein [Halothiobacillus neapolitanus]ACX95774.1 hypothetical protein Hneap_0932 [Halothiobacillus neapolitanus c2]TDN66082.1 hypothetical protein C8D83_101403 [Halothiobacillus neapolitanus]